MAIYDRKQAYGMTDNPVIKQKPGVDASNPFTTYVSLVNKNMTQDRHKQPTDFTCFMFIG